MSILKLESNARQYREYIQHLYKINHKKESNTKSITLWLNPLLEIQKELSHSLYFIKNYVSKDFNKEDVAYNTKEANLLFILKDEMIESEYKEKLTLLINELKDYEDKFGREMKEERYGMARHKFLHLIILEEEIAESEQKEYTLV